ncbi:hypothetical protein [Hymenobacter arizonensis]|uniref:Uncharacterized protein n=1 Tax=Hymenobacter arizonensis TaxID=1227077 RepID=A0A1I5SNY5_HYMAR|nr:hypothetical protein [Hymenobacter arizonensis]SFP72351.1 hypothetical protein SAMN04515668_0130 [Hymenobacter arizonensis]
MTVTRLKRKHRKNIARANNKQHIIKELLRTPVLKNVDLEELKSRFTTTGTATGAVAAVKNTAAAAVENATGAVDAVKNTAAAAVEKVKEVVADAVESVKEAVSGSNDSTAADNAESFDDAEAVTKPVNEDDQAGEHPKPEIAL